MHRCARSKAVGLDVQHSQKLGKMQNSLCDESWYKDVLSVHAIQLRHLNMCPVLPVVNGKIKFSLEDSSEKDLVL